ncbi:23417_t:CDS:2, partial [Gigaspora rosea]
MDDILSNKFMNDDILYDYVINNKRSPTFEKIKKDSSQKLRDTSELYLQPTFFKSFDHAYDDIDMNKNQFAILIAQSEFNCRADIFQASHCSNMIEMLKDKTRLKTFEDHKDYRTENKINSEIVKFQDQQKNIVNQIPALSHFAQVIKKNSICEMREFAQQVDMYFKTHLYDFSQKDHVDDHLTILEAIYGLKVKDLENGYRTWICESESIQILEGVSLRILDADFLLAVLSNILSDNKRQLIVISVIGLESSGKSTLLNYLFQCGFSTSAGRCGNKLDVLIIDSEGIGSTAQKYISRRTDFDKKNDSFGLNVLTNRIFLSSGCPQPTDSKPRINFVLRDMKDAKSAQGPAFLDIRENLRKMFQEIPGCAFDMEDFMIVEEKDVHLLENAFSCSFDDFNPQSMITNNDNFHFPAETFPLKISNLREKLLTSALIPSENHESQIFKNVHGFIAHMQSIWKEIDAHGNFLHFKNSKDIQQWNAIKKIVSSYEETLLESYKVAGLKLIDERAELNHWTKNDDILFERCLDQETNKYLSQALADFQLKVSNQYNPKLIDEGITHINSAFFLENRNFEAKYTKRQRQSKELQLIKLAKDKIGEAVGKILEENKDKTPENFEKIFSKPKRDELFDIEWKRIEEDYKTFMLTMLIETKKLEEHVVKFFNQAIEDGTSKINDLQVLECIKIKGQALLEKAMDILEYTTGYQASKKNELKNIVGNVIKTEIKKTSEQICNKLKDNNALAIEFSQALEWLKRLYVNIFIVIVNNYNKPQDNFTIEIDNFCYAE